MEFRHSSINAKSQLPKDIPIERHIWVRLRDPNCEKRKVSDTARDTLQWTKQCLLPLLTSIPLNRATHLTINAADAFAVEEIMGIGGWVQRLLYLLVQSFLEEIGPQPIPPCLKKASMIHHFVGSPSTTVHNFGDAQQMYLPPRNHQRPIRIRQYRRRSNHQPRFLNHWHPHRHHQIGFHQTDPMQYHPQHSPFPRWEGCGRWQS